MEQTFGAFIRQRRLESMIKLNVFASQIGISNVYLSYIETGKRPAPSKPILDNIAKALSLSKDDTILMHSLAALSHHKNDFSADLIEYINSRPYVMETLQLAITKNAAEDEWIAFSKLLNIKLNSPSKKQNE